MLMEGACTGNVTFVVKVYHAMPLSFMLYNYPKGTTQPKVVQVVVKT